MNRLNVFSNTSLHCYTRTRTNTHSDIKIKNYINEIQDILIGDENFSNDLYVSLFPTKHLQRVILFSSYNHTRLLKFVLCIALNMLHYSETVAIYISRIQLTHAIEGPCREPESCRASLESIAGTCVCVRVCVFCVYLCVDDVAS